MEKYQKILFWTLAFLFFIGLVIAWTFAEVFIRLRLGYPIHGSLSLPIFFAPLMAIALILSVIVCRFLGIIKLTKAVEIYNRNPASAPVTQSLELRSPPSQYGGLAVACGVFALGIALAVRLLPAAPGTKIYGYGLAAFFAFFAVLCLIGMLGRGDFIARIETNGIKKGSKMVLWKDIATLEIATQDWTFGKGIFYIIKDNAGTMQMMLVPAKANDATRQAFLDALQSQFLPAETPTNDGLSPEGVWPPPPQRGKNA